MVEQRTDAGLFQASLQGDYEDEAAWDAVDALRKQPHFDECVSIAIEHLRDEDVLVVHAAAWALSHLGSDVAVSALIDMRSNSDPGVRWAIACGMVGKPAEDARATLIELMDDVDDEVRDWATFELGTQCDVDTPEIRAALRKRLSDGYEEARNEAIWGVARRNDEQGLGLLLARLDSDHWSGDEMAAEDILGLKSDVPVEELRDGLRKLLPP